MGFGLSVDSTLKDIAMMDDVGINLSLGAITLLMLHWDLSVVQIIFSDMRFFC